MISQCDRAIFRHAGQSSPASQVTRLTSLCMCSDGYSCTEDLCVALDSIGPPGTTGDASGCYFKKNSGTPCAEKRACAMVECAADNTALDDTGCVYTERPNFCLCATPSPGTRLPVVLPPTCMSLLCASFMLSIVTSGQSMSWTRGHAFASCLHQCWGACDNGGAMTDIVGTPACTLCTGILHMVREF